MLSSFFHVNLVRMPSLLYSKFLHSKLCLFVFGATFAAWHPQFISSTAFFVASVCKSSKLIAQMRGQGAINLLVVEAFPPQQKLYYSRRSFIFFLISVYVATFFLSFLLVFAKRSFAFGSIVFYNT